MATITEVYGNAAAVRSMFRNAVGHPDQTVLLEDDTVDQALARALAKLNVDQPLISIGTFPTVKDQQIYTPLPAGAYRLRRVLWPISGGSCVPWEPMMSSPIDEAGTRTLSEPFSVFGVLQQSAWLRKLSPTGATILVGSVYLNPVPSKAGVLVPFSYELPRYASAGLIQDAHQEAFITLAEHYLHERLGSGAGAVTAVVDEGITVTTKQPEHHMKQAEAKLRKYISMQPPPAYPSAFP